MLSVLFLVSAQALNIKEQYLGFLAKYGKTWRDSGFAAFEANVEQTQNSTTHGVGPFFDLTPAEFRAMYLSPIREPYHIITESNFTDAPPSVDWRTSGVVPPVWDQGQQGDVIHFVTADNLVSVSAILRKEKVVNPANIRNMLQICTSSCAAPSIECDFNFSVAEGVCSGFSKDCKCPPDFTYSGFKTIKDEANLLNAVAVGPVSAYVDAESWQTYAGGILSRCSGKNLDHAVLVVGYGTQSGQDYWIVKNSWGTSWGEAGYLRLARQSSGPGLCSIAVGDYLPVAAK